MTHPAGADPGPYFHPLTLIKTGLLKINSDGSMTLNELTGLEPKKLKDAWNYFNTKRPFKKFTIGDLNGTKLSLASIEIIKRRTVRNPLEIQYFSAAPFRFGPDRAMKYSVIPAAGALPQQAFGPQEPSVLKGNYGCGSGMENPSH